MAKAFQCDRCGQCFAPGEAEFVQMSDLAYVRGDKYSKRYDRVDLCLECSHDFKEWMSKKNE